MATPAQASILIKAAEAKLADLLGRFGGKEIAPDWVGYHVYQEGAVIMGILSDQGETDTIHGKTGYVVIDGQSDSVMKFSAELGDEPSEAKGAIRLILTEGAENKFSKVPPGSYVVFFVHAKVPTSNGHAFWATKLVQLPDSGERPRFDDVKFRRQRVGEVASGRVPNAGGDFETHEAGDPPPQATEVRTATPMKKKI